MAHIKRKYIDSHWLVFIFQGAVTLFFGCIMLFTAMESSVNLIPLIGLCLLVLAVVEFANSLYRSHHREGWLVATMVALFDAIFGLALLFVTNYDMVWHLSILSAYTLLRGIFEMVIGFRTTVDPTDRFIWLLCGIAGVIFGIVIFNSGHLANVDFIRFFGAYMLILGVGSLIYGVHNREQGIEDRNARSEAIREARKAKLKSSTKKPSRKS